MAPRTRDRAWRRLEKENMKRVTLEKRIRLLGRLYGQHISERFLLRSERVRKGRKLNDCEREHIFRCWRANRYWESKLNRAYGLWQY